MRVDEHTIEFASTPVFIRTAPVAQTAGATPVYLHGIPTSSDVWTAVLERMGGVAPDLIGFGRSGKGGHLEYTLATLAEFAERVIEHERLQRIVLVGHGWGAAVALELAARMPDRTERVALVDPVPLTPGYAPPKILTTKLSGELAMGAITHWLLARRLRQGATAPSAWTDARIAAVWDQFDQGTQRAILRLYRATTPGHLTGLVTRNSHPVLVLHGEADPWFTPDQAVALTDNMPNASGVIIEGAAHWPWLDRPQDTLAALEAFLAP